MIRETKSWRLFAMPETLEFKAELKQLLHLITHSLYSDREIFRAS